MTNALVLNNVGKRFDGLVALKNVSVSVSAGRVTSLIGPNGAGKTTLFNLVSGFEKPDTGSIYQNSNRLDGLSAFKIARLGVGRLFQDVRVFNKLTVLENLLLARRRRGENPMRAVFGRHDADRADRDYVELAKRQLDTFGLLEQLDSLAEGLSYGQQKLLAISRLLLGSFDVFLLDEPFSGVNPGMVSRIQEVIQELAHKQKIVVIIEHDMHVVRSISDWSFFLFEGTILASGTPDHVLADADVRKAYLLL